MAIEDLVQDASRRMDKSVEAAQAEFATLRTGRASAALLDRIQIDYYGTADAAQAARDDQRAGAAHAHHPALRPDLGLRRSSARSRSPTWA